MYWWCLGWWDDCDEFSGVQDNKEHPITKKSKIENTKEKLDSDINALVEDTQK